MGEEPIFVEHNTFHSAIYEAGWSLGIDWPEWIE